MEGIRINVLHQNALHQPGDVLVLKYAEAAYGLDKKVIKELERTGYPIANQLPQLWEHTIVSSRGISQTPDLLFVGVPYLMGFGYREIREFGRLMLAILANRRPLARTILMTIHGPGYGLDEAEAFKAQIAGLVDSVQADEYPTDLREIIFMEANAGRSKRLRAVLDELFPDGQIPTIRSGGIRHLRRSSVETLRSVGYESKSKKRVFVAMPFAEKFADIYDYGILGAVNAAGYLCERADMESFTGDIMEWVKERIATADIVVADLSGANANVYLEVGYAWGKGRPTILLVDSAEKLKFDVQGQRCLKYSRIKELEEKLKNELVRLTAQSQ